MRTNQFSSNKKGANELGGLLPTIFVLLTVAIAVSVMAVVVSNVQSTQPKLSTNVTNETFTWTLNNTAVTLKNNDIVPGSEIVWNTSGNSFLLTGTLYVVNYTGGLIYILNTSTSSSLNTALRISYNYYYGSPAYNATGAGLTGVNTFASYIPTVALVSVAAIIVGLIMAFFILKKKED